VFCLISLVAFRFILKTRLQGVLQKYQQDIREEDTDTMSVATGTGTTGSDSLTDQELAERDAQLNEAIAANQTSDVTNDETKDEFAQPQPHTDAATANHVSPVIASPDSSTSETAFFPTTTTPQTLPQTTNNNFITAVTPYNTTELASKFNEIAARQHNDTANTGTPSSSSHAHHQQQSKKTRSAVKFLQFLSSNWCFAIVLGLCLFIYYALLLTLFFSLQSKFPILEQRCRLLRIMYAVYVSIEAGITFVLFFIDCSSYYKDCLSFNCKRPYCEQDPLLYRMEIQSLFTILVVVVVLTISLNFTLTGETVDIVSQTFKFAFDLFVMVSLPGIALVGTYYYDISVYIINWKNKGKNMEHEQPISPPEQQQSQSTDKPTNNTTPTIVKKNIALYAPEMDTLRTLLTTSRAAELFKEFSKLEFSIENILFYEDVQRFKGIVPPPKGKSKQVMQALQAKRFKVANRIYGTYLDHQRAVMEVNIPQPIREQVHVHIKTAMQQGTPLPDGIFDTCETSIIANLIDMYSRFFRSKGFQTYLSEEYQYRI